MKFQKKAESITLQNGTNFGKKTLMDVLSSQDGILTKTGNSENLNLFFGQNGILKDENQIKYLLEDNSIWEKVKDLIESGNPENMKLFFGASGIIKNLKDLKILMENIEGNRFNNFIKYQSSDNLELFFGDNGLVKTLEEFLIILKYEKGFNNIKNFAVTGKKQNLIIFFGQNGILKKVNDLLNFIGNTKYEENFKNLIVYGNADNINLIFALYSVTNKKKLKQLMKNKNYDKIYYLIENGKTINFQKFLNFYDIKNPKDLESLMISSDWDDLRNSIQYGTSFLKQVPKWLFYDNLLGDKISIQKNLFQVWSGGSYMFDYIFKLMEKLPKDYLYSLIDQDINNNLKKYTKNLKKYGEEEKEKNFQKLKPILEMNTIGENEFIEKLKIDTDRLELSVYLRYGRTVDYPEIGEYAILFLNKYIQKGYSKYLSGIRLIPRQKYVFPRNGFFEGNDIKKYNVDLDEFRTALNQYSIPFYFSHSKFESKKNIPSIISGSMKGNDKSINLGLELEEIYDKFGTNKKSLNELLENLVGIMQKLDKKIDETISEHHSSDI